MKTFINSPKRIQLLCSVLLILFILNCHVQNKIVSEKRTVDFSTTLKYIGHVKTRSTHEIKSSNWLLGCETLDRDFADYEQYKTFLDPLGIKKLRFQAGWAKTEKVKGEYNWEWLDKIINDAVQRGCEPWLQTSYGNPIYPGGGDINLSAGIPTSQEALDAWNRWVESMVLRYQDKVNDWEIWNEPNFGDNVINTPEDVAALNIRTAEIIKRVQPNACISGLAMGHIDLDYADRFFKYIDKQKKMHLFDNMTYHDYVYNPDANFCHVEALQNVLEKYTADVKLRQGENGAPSMGGANRGALGDYHWTELSQAKWCVRRMLDNLGHDIESSIFAIIDMNYNIKGPITKLNVKGIIQSDSTLRAVRPKMAYYAIQNITAIFDDSFQRIKKLHPTYNANSPLKKSEVKYCASTDRSLAVYGYTYIKTGKQLFTIWMDEYIPQNENTIKTIHFSFLGSQIDKPVYIDILTGKVYNIPKNYWRKKDHKLMIDCLPVYDSPILVADESLIRIE